VHRDRERHSIDLLDEGLVPVFNGHVEGDDFDSGPGQGSRG